MENITFNTILYCMEHGEDALEMESTMTRDDRIKLALQYHYDCIDDILTAEEGHEPGPYHGEQIYADYLEMAETEYGISKEEFDELIAEADKIITLRAQAYAVFATTTSGSWRSSQRANRGSSMRTSSVISMVIQMSGVLPKIRLRS